MNDETEKKDNKRNDDSIFLVPAPRTKKPKIQTNSVRRSSVRLQLKKCTSEIIQSPYKDNKRRSVRLQKRENILNTTVIDNKTKKKSPTVKKTKAANTKNIDSPTTLRTRQVLQILNDGSLKELEKLHTVGAKTAEKIYLFRLVCTIHIHIFV